LYGLYGIESKIFLLDKMAQYRQKILKPKYYGGPIMDMVVTDPLFCLETMTQIVSKDRETVPFVFNEPQLRYWYNRTHRDIILKARQIGFSTEVMGLFLHDTMFTPNTRSTIVAQTEKVATQLFSRVLFMFNSIPEEVRPTIHGHGNRKELFFPKINSTFSIGSSEARGFGRGDTIQNLHCLHPDVMILGEHGVIKKISEVGVPTKTWDGELISIHVRMNPKQPIITTPDHLILTKKGWKRADEISTSDKIAQERRRIGSKEVLLNSDIGWIIGMFLSEGSTQPNGNAIIFTLSLKEEDFAARIRMFFNANLKKEKKYNRIRVSVYDKKWHDYLRENFYLNPNSGHDKIIPDWVFDTNKKFCDGIIRGCLDGDGCNRKDQNTYVSKRPQLTYQLRDLICALGYGWCSVTKSLDVEKRGHPWKKGKVYESYRLRMLGATLKKFRGESLPETTTQKAYERKKSKNSRGYKFGKQEFVGERVIKSKILFGQRYEIKNDFVYQNVWKIEKVSYRGQLYDMINQPDGQFRTITGVVKNCTEVSLATWDKDFLDGLLESVPKRGRVVLESTARGEGGVFYDMYFDAKNGKNEYKIHYYRWFELPEYTEPLLIPKEDFIATYDYEEQELVNKYNLTPEQINWRRFKKNRLRGMFVQEYPEWDDEDAFIKTGSPIFDIDLLRARDRELVEQSPTQITLGGELYVYRYGQPGAKYIISVDTSEGDIHSDFGAAVVTRYLPLPVEQCALLHGRWSPDILSEKVYKLAKAYNYGTIAVERNNHGHAVLLNLANGIVRKGAVAYPPYPHLYIGPDKKLGWHTGPLSKPQMMNELDRAIRSEELVINSKPFILEARRVVAIKGGGYGVPPTVGNDDIVCAQAIGLMCIGGGDIDFDFI
jgi:hypothetical protein